MLLNSLREELHLYAQKSRATWSATSSLVDSGDEIDCSRMGSGGYGIPSIVEPEVIQFKKCDAKFVLHVEKDTVWQRFNEDKFWRKQQLHPHPRRRPAAARRAAAALPPAQRTEAAGLLPAG